MESNPQNYGKAEYTRWSTDDQGETALVRSFTCAFCNRGFSNAQALGGHMNIHRRDRAKLRQSSEEKMTYVDISIKNATEHEAQPKDDDYVLERGKAIQVPLFTERQSSSKEIRATGSVVVERIEEKKTDLDLELRLGLEPLERSPTLSTREFF
ncbi:hypothetical protein RIF29_00794 [Crotalaria pallida]|uniref:C2H2-type domain-containing protein n=1 Tax=Crotalaria pallida TaxID=3830 RepID=A0AAN9IW63_CROPI